MSDFGILLLVAETRCRCLAGRVMSMKKERYSKTRVGMPSYSLPHRQKRLPPLPSRLVALSEKGGPHAFMRLSVAPGRPGKTLSCRGKSVGDILDLEKTAAFFKVF